MTLGNLFVHLLCLGGAIAAFMGCIIVVAIIQGLLIKEIQMKDKDKDREDFIITKDGEKIPFNEDDQE